MSMPNLSSRPFLNTRPVWLVTVVAGTLALALAALNLHLLLATNRASAAQLERREQLLAERRDLESALRGDTAALARIPWRTLARRVNDLNLVLRERTFSWLDLLDDVERVLPRQARIIRITPTFEKEGVRLGIDGIAQRREDLLDFIDNLVADAEFDEPKPRSETSPEQAPAAGYQFSLEVRYLPIATAVPVATEVPVAAEGP
jgi:Tfp pilus assembly protein PilN